MSLYNKISNLFNLSTPVIDDDIERLLANKELRNKLLEAIDEERENYASDEKSDDKHFDGIKRVGEFEFNL
jgi:hypothetical protein